MTNPVTVDAAAREALRLIGPDPENWVPPRDGIDHTVAIIGGGQTGTTFAFALRRAGIGGVSVIEAAPDERSTGVWLTRARMEKLRTPKNLPGPELGIPGLSFQSWYEARHGREAYAALTTIPRIDWANYLIWYKDFLGIPVRYGVRVKRIEPAKGLFRLHLESEGRAWVETARKVLLANGVGGNGGPFIPPVLTDNLPRALYAHTADAIDFAAVEGKSVAVLGAAASAFDAAATALEAGAAEVHLFARRAEIASVPINRVRGYPGAYDNYPALPDSIRWRQALRFLRAGSTPPPDAVRRVVRFDNFHLHLAAPWTAARQEDGRIVATAAGEDFVFDFAIAGTGYFVDPAARPELADAAGRILRWRDRYTPPPDERHEGLGAHPYLGLGHEYLEKEPGTAPYLKDIHVYNPGGFVSFGLPIGDVPSFRRDIPSVVARISRDLFLADLDAHERRITSTIAAEFDASLYASAIWRGARAAAE
ncbi:cation diffusion facilitator CzcD-associated flavoprotein CzcO [Ancylobacter sp. 3268]|uniref:NAD(P)-binding domain-containing protein n=1 Tax=Ancylobacter sp. 3268 TaxID=2817752 RepID=UPI0028601F51|nr:NAD(P)-binding domain-containing protein [Ancylobacter sp. 3268]MDR6951154.1 cation diffusion facilitator CzcD-associated flavoprotein CzcO [Ancylobacter sp. 3268]